MLVVLLSPDFWDSNVRSQMVMSLANLQIFSRLLVQRPRLDGYNALIQVQ
jgi:hypothetical protein